MEKRIISLIITIGFLVVLIFNFFKDLNLLLLISNCIGFFLVMTILITHVKYLIFNNHKN